MRMFKMHHVQTLKSSVNVVIQHKMSRRALLLWSVPIPLCRSSTERTFWERGENNDHMWVDIGLGTRMRYHTLPVFPLYLSVFLSCQFLKHPFIEVLTMTFNTGP